MDHCYIKYEWIWEIKVKWRMANTKVYTMYDSTCIMLKTRQNISLILGVRRVLPLGRKQGRGRIVGRHKGLLGWWLSWSIQAAITNHHRLSGLNNKHLFLTILEAGKSKIKAPADSVATYWYTGGQLPAMSSHCGRGGRALWGLFYKGNNPTHEGSTLMI